MSRRGLRLFGHPVHPMLAAFPVAFWLGGSLWDAVALLRPEPHWSQLAFWSLLLGTVLALPVAASGFWDLIVLPPEHPAQTTAWWHLAAMATAGGCYFASLALRRDTLGEPATWSAVALAGVGGLLCIGGGWLGGELVFRYGVGVRRREEES